MNYKETGFRVLYKHFAAFMLTNRLRETIEGFQNAKKANCVLTYGYIDHTAGFTEASSECVGKTVSYAAS